MCLPDISSLRDPRVKRLDHFIKRTKTGCSDDEKPRQIKDLFRSVRRDFRSG
jgi:hypothetical protein